MSNKKSGTNVLIRHEGILYRFCKLWFGSDGTYYVTVPKFSVTAGLLMKNTVNYNTGFREHQWIGERQQVDLASLNEGLVKLSHHPSGFCQFSGPGVSSGTDAEGNPKGVSVKSWPLIAIPPAGSAFSVVASSLSGFEVIAEASGEDATFDSAAMLSDLSTTGFCVEGYYFQPKYRRFARPTNDGWEIELAHPTGAIVNLRAIPAPIECAIPAMFGLHFYREEAELPPPSYTLNGPGGNMRTNEKGERLADTLSFLCSDSDKLLGRRNVDYAAEPPPSDQLTE
jgi:hypothetical protein